MPLSQYAAARKDAWTPAPKFQHRHFAAIARIIANMPAAGKDSAALAFAEGLARTNPNFDRQRFLAACYPNPGKDFT